MLRVILSYLLIAAIGVWFVIMILMVIDMENKPNAIILQNQNDSLKSELNIVTIEKGRYEYMIDILRQNDSVKVDSLLKHIE